LAPPRLVILAAVSVLVIAPVPRSVSAQPTEADVFVAEGILALESKQYEAALNHFRQALERETGHVEALYYSGVALMALQRPAEAVPFLERAHEKSPDELSIAFELGLVYFTLNQYDKAESLLEASFARDPSLHSLGYYVGYVRYRKENYQGALRAFRAGRTADPNIAQLTSLYSALSLAALGLPAQAVSEVEQALKTAPGSPLTSSAERLRDSMVAARSSDRRLRADVRVGGFYDNNVTTRPDPKAGDATVQALRRRNPRSAGELFSLRLEYDWLRAGPWDATVGYSFFTTYNNELPSFNVIDHLATLGVSRRDTLLAMPFQSGAQYSYDYLLLGGNEFLQRHSLSLFGLLVENATHLTTAQARVQIKEFSGIQPLVPEELQDATNGMIGFLHLVRFSGERHFLKGGYQFDVEDSKGSDFDYHGHRLLAGAQYTLPWADIRLSYDFEFHYRDYLHRNVVFPDNAPGTRARSDREYTHLARVLVPLPYNLSLSGEFQSTINRSNLAVFSYHRDVFSLSMGWQY